jgi:hypothetical protein
VIYLRELQDSCALLDNAFLEDLTAKFNVLITGLLGEHKTVIKMIGTVDYFQGKLKLWKTQLVS